MAISVPVSARAMVGGSKWCFAKFLDESTVERIENPDALCGNRDPLLQRTLSGRKRIQFTLFHDVTIPILQALLPLAGTTNASGTYTANQIISTTEIVVDKVGSIHRYTNCRMDRFILRGQVGTMPVSAESRWIAEDETEYPGASWVDGTVDNIWGFPGSTHSVAGTSYNIDRFAFVIDNKLVPSWNASETVTDVGMGPRQTLLATSVPYVSPNDDLYWNYRTSVAGAAIALAINNGTDTCTINFPKGISIPASPDIVGALTEIRLDQTWEAKRQAAVAAFNVVLVNT